MRKTCALLAFCWLGALPAWAAERLAVLEITGELSNDERALITDTVRGSVVETVGASVQVMTRENMEVMLTDMGLDASCVAEGACEVETARNLGVDYVVSGSLTAMGDMLIGSLKLHETGSGQLLASKQARGADALAVMDAMGEAGVEVAVRLSRDNGAPGTAPTAVVTSSAAPFDPTKAVFTVADHKECAYPDFSDVRFSRGRLTVSGETIDLRKPENAYSFNQDMVACGHYNLALHVADYSAMRRLTITGVALIPIGFGVLAAPIWGAFHGSNKAKLKRYLHEAGPAVTYRQPANMIDDPSKGLVVRWGTPPFGWQFTPVKVADRPIEEGVDFGLEPGDKVLSVAGVPVVNAEQWTGVLEMVPPGAWMTIEVERARERHLLEGRLPTSPGDSGTNDTAIQF